MATTVTMRHQAPETTDGPLLYFMLGSWLVVFLFLFSVFAVLTYMD